MLNYNFLKMKKILLSMVITIAAMQLSAQQIVVDKVEENGTRLIVTQKVYSGYPGIYVGLSSYRVKIGQSDTTVYKLSIRYGSQNKRQISVGRKLLLKLSDNNIITLENAEEIGATDYTSELVQPGTYYERMVYYVFPDYDITESQISQICKNEVIKIRLEYNSGEYTIEETKRKKNKFATVIRNAYSEIQETYKTEKDIYTDF